MPTTVTKTIKSSGGDYTTLSAWEAANQADLTATDEIRQAECYTFVDNSTTNITGWTTDATRYIRVFAASGSEAAMPYGGGYRIERTAPNDCLYWDEAYVRVERISCQASASAAAASWFCVSQATTGESRVIGCLVRLVANTATSITCRHIGTGGTMIVVNTVVHSTGSTGAAIAIGKSNNTNLLYAYNCLAYRCTTAFRGNGTTGVFKNCIYDKGDITAGSHFDAAHGDSNYNASTEAGVPGANSRSSQTFTFTNEVGEDFHLDSADGGAKGFGVDLSGDATYPFSVDFDNASRSVPWDMGPTKAEAAGGGLVMRRRREEFGLKRRSSGLFVPERFRDYRNQGGLYVKAA